MTLVDAASQSGPRNPGSAFNVLTIYCVALILFVGTDFFSILLGAEGVGGPKFLCYVGIFGICGCFWHTYTRGMISAPPLLLLLITSCLSVVWSINPGETAERLIALLACSSIGILIGSGHSLRGLVLFLGVLATVVAWCCLLAVVGFPEARGTPPWDTTWRGIFNHKNGLGGAMAIGLPFMLYAAIISKGSARWFFISGVSVGLLMLVASESRTAQIVGLIAIANLLFGVFFVSRKLTWATVALLLLAFASSLVFLLFATGLTDAIFAALDRKPTISGRIPIWGLAWPYIMDRPLLGYGYHAFWDPESDRVMMMAVDPDLRFAPFYSHNGLVETLLALGVAGVGLLFWVILGLFRAVIRILKLTAKADDLVPVLVFAISFCLLNVTESSVLQRDDMTWITFVAIVVRVHTLLKKAEPLPELPRNSVGAWPLRRTGVSI